jgi:hypothetical protein
MNLLRGEWLKLWTTRTTWVMLGIALLGETLFAGLYVGLASVAEIEGPVEEPEGLTTVATGVGLLLVMMLVLGVLIATTEFRSRDRQLDLPGDAEALAIAAREARGRARGRASGWARLRRRQRRPRGADLLRSRRRPTRGG